MLIEFAKHLLTPAPTILKEMGYVRELIAIEAREKRCHEAWKPHCESSMQEIKEFTSHVTETSCIAILGAALLNDVPLAYLASRFKRVELVDIVHLPSTRTKAAQFDNVVCVECDVTGYVETLYKYCKDGDKRSVLPKPSVPQLYVGVSGKPSCIVSANILSQLPIMPSLYAEKKCGYSDSELFPIKQQLVQLHLKWLHNLNIPYLIIADHVEEYRTSDGRIADSESSTYSVDVSLPHCSEWEWLLAPQGEEYKEYSVVHRVRSYRHFAGS